MKIHLLILLLCICFSQMIYSQEDDGVVSLNLPIRNSLTFNRFIINPTFSFVREQNKYISIYNKREWVEFEDAPLTYLASYSGRFGENIGAGIAVFQQNYGVLTTFGGTVNFAYNVSFTRESNLTFGLNIGAYKSGVNTGNVTTNFEDPSLQNVPENFLLSISPGINYGVAFLDFGVTVNNLALYNFESSELIEDNPEQNVQAHIMYTGYMDSRGFFEESKFSGLLRSEFREDETTISAIAMLTVPKGIWAQAGYNTLYGISGGIGLNITSQIAVEYNYEKALGDLSNFGSSHNIALAYRFKNEKYYSYGSDDEVVGLFDSNKRVKKSSKKTKAKTDPALAAKRKAEAQAKLVVDQKAKEDADIQAKLLAEQKAIEDVEAQAKLLAEQKAKEDAEAQIKLLAEQKAIEDAEVQAKLVAEQKAKEETDIQARLLAEQKAIEDAKAQTKLVAEQKAKEEAEVQAKLLAEQKAIEDAKAQAKLVAEQKVIEDAEAQTKLLAEQKAKEDAEAQAKLLAEQKAIEEAEADAKAKLLAEQEAEEALISNPKDELGKAMYNIAQQTEVSKTIQEGLLKQYKSIIDIKDVDLKDLKEENDLSEQGVALAPKPFKSITEENKRLTAIKSDLDAAIKERNEKIKELKALYEDNFESDTILLDPVYVYYRKAISRLEAEQLAAMKIRSQLEKRLEEIRVATEFERNRRIKRAAFDNEDERYAQDRVTLQNIKQSTQFANQALQANDFDFGEEQSSSIQILKNVKNVDNGYYLILAVHSNIDARNDFVTKVVASGRKDVDFFYDASTSKYYIYYEKFENIQAANRGIESKEDKPYNNKMSLIKIEN